MTVDLDLPDDVKALLRAERLVRGDPACGAGRRHATARRFAADVRFGSGRGARVEEGRPRWLEGAGRQRDAESSQSEAARSCSVTRRRRSRVARNFVFAAASTPAISQATDGSEAGLSGIGSDRRSANAGPRSDRDPRESCTVDADRGRGSAGRRTTRPRRGAGRTRSWRQRARSRCDRRARPAVHAWHARRGALRAPRSRALSARSQGRSAVARERDARALSAQLPPSADGATREAESSA